MSAAEPSPEPSSATWRIEPPKDTSVWIGCRRGKEIKTEWHVQERRDVSRAWQVSSITSQCGRPLTSHGNVVAPGNERTVSISR